MSDIILGKEKVLGEKSATTSYRSIFKATSLFGGVQFWKILIMIVQTKFVAVLLGPSGMGIKGLYSSAISLILCITAMGLSNSAVRDVSLAYGSGDSKRVSHVIAVVRKLVWITGFLGMFTVIAMSPLLSKITFGCYSYIIPFIILSSSLLLSQLTTGQNVLLQGLRKLTYLAKAGVVGSLIGLFITVPLFYLLKTNGIVPALVLDSLALFLIARYYAQKVKIEKTDVSFKEAIHDGKGMIGLGLVMTYNSMLVYGTSYILRVFITQSTGVSDVGLFNAGFAVMNTYVGLIFTAMATDYYPRLAAVSNDNNICKTIINQQMVVAILIIVPLMLFFLPIAPFAIIAIYSGEFLPIVSFIQWSSLGVCLKAISWSISFYFIAKGDKKTFAINETTINIVGLIMNIFGYKFWGITGLGISSCVNHTIYVILVYMMAHYKYGFCILSSVKKIIAIMMICLFILFLLLSIWKEWWVYVPAAFIVIIGSLYAYKELSTRLGINLTVVRSMLKK